MRFALTSTPGWQRNRDFIRVSRAQYIFLDTPVLIKDVPPDTDEIRRPAGNRDVIRNRNFTRIGNSQYKVVDTPALMYDAPPDVTFDREACQAA